MIKPIKGCKYDVIARRNGASLGVLETLEYDDGVDFEEWLAMVCLASDAFIADEAAGCDEIVIAIRTGETEGHYHGVMLCSISSKS